MAANSVDSSQIVSGAVDFDHLADVVDEDNMVSNSATKLATQQSIKAYVDSLISGLDLKESVVVSSTADLAGTYNNGAGTYTASGNGAFPAMDGFTADEEDMRILLKDQGDGEENGVYDLTTVGDAGNPWVLTRSSDFNANAEFNGAPFVLVENGTVNGAHGFVCTNMTAVTLGTTAITFNQFSAPGQDSVAGDGLAMSGNVLSLDLNELGNETSIAQADFVPMVDAGDSGSEKITFSNFEDQIFANVTTANLDVVIAAGGGATIQNDKVVTAKILDANVTLAKVENVASARLIVGNASSRPAAVDVTGDVTIGNSGVTAIGNNKVLTGMINDANVTLAKVENVTSAQFIVGSAGNRPVAVTMSGDATLANDGEVTIAATAVQASMLNADVAPVDGGILFNNGALKLNIVKKEFLGSAGANSTINKTGGTVNTTLFDSGDLQASTAGATQYSQVFMNGLLQRGRVKLSAENLVNGDGDDLEGGTIDYVWDADSEVLHFLRTDIAATDEILVFFAG